MRINVIGGGLFGCTAAIKAARAGHDVHLYEIKSELMSGATASTFARLHRGAHYPRDAATGRESRAAEASFRDEYGSCVIDGGNQFYMVPIDEQNKVTADQFEAFLDREQFAFERRGQIFQVSEPRVNLAGLQALVRQKIAQSGVTVHLEERGWVGGSATIIATYAGLNDYSGPQNYKFQLVERPLVLLPEKFANTSIVVIDGPYGCLDPLDHTPLHILGHVTASIHCETVGLRPAIPHYLRDYVDAGLIRSPKYTYFNDIVSGLARYVPGVEKAQHIGSSYVIRAVLSGVSDTDKRPTIVTDYGANVFSIFSGKLGTACQAAEQVLRMIHQPDEVMA